MNSSMVNRYIE